MKLAISARRGGSIKSTTGTGIDAAAALDQVIALPDSATLAQAEGPYGVIVVDGPPPVEPVYQVSAEPSGRN